MPSKYFFNLLLISIILVLRVEADAQEVSLKLFGNYLPLNTFAPTTIKERPSLSFGQLINPSLAMDWKNKNELILEFELGANANKFQSAVRIYDEQLAYIRFGFRKKIYEFSEKIQIEMGITTAVNFFRSRDVAFISSIVPGSDIHLGISPQPVIHFQFDLSKVLFLDASLVVPGPELAFNRIDSLDPTLPTGQQRQTGFDFDLFTNTAYRIGLGFRLGTVETNKP